MGDLLGALYGDDMSGDDESGEDMGDESGGVDDILGDILGRRKRGRAGKPKGWNAPSAGGKNNWLGQYIQGGMIGAPPVTEKMYPIAFPVATFLPAGVGAQIIQANPQLACKPERPVVLVLRTAGAAAVGVNLDDIKVGQRSQFINAGSIPAETFSGANFGVRLSADPAGPGVLVSLFYSITLAVPAANTVTVQSTIISRAAG